MSSKNWQKGIVGLGAATSVFLPSWGALLLGLVLALLFGEVFGKEPKVWATRLLAISIVGLGAGMKLDAVLRSGSTGVGYTAIGITLTCLLGLGLTALLSVPKRAALLVTVGTAICGGSAIAAVGATLRAKEEEMAIALGTVFCLNSLALFLFPWVGRELAMSPHQFGLWSALAIHDTSSVVGAAVQFGPEALQTGTTVKLTRALWIIPLTVTLSVFYSNPGERKVKLPWFIVGFLVMTVLFSYVPFLQPVSEALTFLSKKMLLLTLFLIGLGLSLPLLRSVGTRPLLHGIVLWVSVSGTSLLLILNGWIV